jgi:hypothetical protein
VAFKVVVQVQDANGNASNVTTNTDVKLAVKTGTGTLGGTFGGTITTGNNSVSIEGITYSKAEGGVVLSVSRISGQDLLPAESAAFSVTAGPAAKLEFTQQPGNGVAGATLAAVKVQLLDASGNPVPSAGIPVTLALGGGAGATLSGGSASTDASGGATFAGLSVNKAGTGYTLAASSGSLAGATSTSFSIQAGAPAKLVFSQQPAAVVAGAGFSVKVQAQDALGNPATLSTPLNITLVRKTGNGTLGGTLSGSIAPSGTSEATISGITYTTAEGGVVITASGGGLSVDSAPFTVVAGPASKLVFTTEPPNPATAGNGFNVVLQVLDANGNPAKVTANTDVKLTLKTGTGTLGGTTSVTISANSGTGTISGITYTKAEAGVVLTAARTNGDSLTPVDTKAFTVNPGAAAKLVFSQQPQPTQPPPTGPIVAGQNFSVKIAVQDSQGNTAIASAGINITLSRKTGTGTLGGTTTGQITAGTSEGTINGITYTKAESGVVLTAAANGLASGDSGAFTVNAGTANKLVFSQPPPNPATAGAPFSIKVQVQDQFNNITTVIAGHTLELSRKTGTGTLGGTTTGALAAGTSEDTINGVTYSKVEGNVVLTAALQDNALPPVDSAAFAVVAGPPAKLVFSQQPQPTPPGPIVAGAAFSVKIAVQDINGNPATVSAAINITLSRIGGTGTLGGTTSGQIATGASETTINGITYTKAESGVQLRAAATGLTNADSAPPFTVVAGAPAKLVFSQPPPTTIISNTALTVKVQILDANDNVVNNANIAVEIVFCTVNTTICPTPVSVSTGTGVATFNLTSPGTPGSYTLTAVLPPNRTIGVAAPVTVT